MIIIQEEIKVSEEWVGEVIKSYEKRPDTFWMGFGEFSGNKEDVINELKNNTEVGKKILMSNYNFEKAYPDVYKELNS